MKAPVESLRADKWLYFVRLFKTRNLATQACDKGNVTLGGQVVKASRLLKPGNEIEVRRPFLTQRLRVLACPPQRLGAALAKDCIDDLTPAEDYQQAAEKARMDRLSTPKYDFIEGKPNKQQVRQMREWRQQQESDSTDVF